MTTGLTVALHDARQAEAPAGWDSFVGAQPLPTVWLWSMVSTLARIRPFPVIAATIHDGDNIRGVATLRLVGARARRGAVPLVGVADVDCLGSASMPGIVCDEPGGTPLHAEAVSALREAVRARYGSRIRALMFRQVSAQLLPSVLRWPAIVREGGPIAYFRNDFATFDEYLASLSKSRRWSLRRSVREIESDDALTISFDGPDTRPRLRVEDLCTLLNVVVRRHHRRWWLRKRLMLPEVARVQLSLPGLRWLTYREPDDTLIGYATVWDHPTEFYVGAWGAREVADGGRKDLWFHFNATMTRWCIEQGRTGYVSGQGSIPEKVRLGHELRRQWAVLVPHR